MPVQLDRGIIGLRRIGITLVAWVCAGLGVALLAAPSYATAAGEIRAQTLLIDEADRAAFGIKAIRWVEASGSTPAHAFISAVTAAAPPPTRRVGS